MGSMSRTKIIITSGLIASLIAVLFPPSYLISYSRVGGDKLFRPVFDFIFATHELGWHIDWQTLTFEFVAIAI